MHCFHMHWEFLFGFHNQILSFEQHCHIPLVFFTLATIHCINNKITGGKVKPLLPKIGRYALLSNYYSCTVPMNLTSILPLKNKPLVMRSNWSKTQKHQTFQPAKFHEMRCSIQGSNLPGLQGKGTKLKLLTC